VGQYGAELLGRERLHERQTENKVVFLPAEKPESRRLHHGSVVFIGQEHTMDTRSA
jgi:hypothetical protein